MAVSGRGFFVFSVIAFDSAALYGEAVEFTRRVLYGQNTGILTKTGAALFLDKADKRMIYLADSTTATDIYFPRTTEAAALADRYGYVGTILHLRHTTTLEERTEGGAVTIDGDYLLAEDFALVDPLAPGEWEYKLTDDPEKGDPVLLGSGILRVGDLPATAPVQYEKPIQYEQYN